MPFTILLHSSKTTRPLAEASLNAPKQQPALHKQAEELATYLKSLSPVHIEKIMKISAHMAQKTYDLIQSWSVDNPTLPAIDLFLGDIYSGLQALSFTESDREYANNHLFILSGLYGVVRALDEIQPYRLEMGYKLIGNNHNASQPDITSLYTYWGNAIANQLPNNQPIINLSAVEYTKAIFPHFKTIEGLKDATVITPKFLTISTKTNEPTFVTVHTKIARGAFARWLIQNRIEAIEELKSFEELGYAYSEKDSTPNEPVFIAKEFKGLGLSVRLS